MFSVVRKHFNLENNTKTKFLVSREFLEIVQPPMPKRYTELEYIESTGTQWIDTNIVPATTIRTLVKAARKDTATGAVVATKTGNYYNYQFTFYLNGYSVCPGGSYDDTTYGCLINTPYIIDYNINSSHQCKINENLIHSTTAETGGTSLTLFKRGTSISLLNGRIYYCRIYLNFENLTLDLIPAKDPDGVVCMYDKVSDTFFYNQGTGDFIAGPEVNV